MDFFKMSIAFSIRNPIVWSTTQQWGLRFKELNCCLTYLALVVSGRFQNPLVLFVQVLSYHIIYHGDNNIYYHFNPIIVPILIIHYFCITGGMVNAKFYNSDDCSGSETGSVSYLQSKSCQFNGYENNFSSSPYYISCEYIPPVPALPTVKKGAKKVKGKSSAIRKL